MRLTAGLFLLTAAGLTGCTGGSHEIVPAPSSPPGSRPTVAGVSLYPASRIVLEACSRAQAVTSRPILCPSLLPRPTVSSASEPGLPPQPMGVLATADPQLMSLGTGFDSVLLSFVYSVPYENDSSKNQPERFLHFEVYARGSCCGPPAEAQRVVLGGKKGLLLRADGVGAYFGNHVRFFWNQGGVAYVATLHSFGAGTTALLGALVAGLRPVQGVPFPAASSSPRRPGVVTAPLSGETGPASIIVAGSSVWVASIGDVESIFQTASWPGSNTGPGLQRFDAATMRPEGAPIRLAPGVDWMPSSLTFGFGRVWTLLRSYRKASTLFGFDPATGALAAKVPVKIPANQNDVTGLASAGDSLWMSVYGPTTVTGEGLSGAFLPGAVWRIDATTGRVLARVGVGAGAVAVAGTANAIWVANYRDDTVTRVDPSTNTAVATIPVGGGPTAIAATPEGVWVTNSLDDSVSRIDPAGNLVVAITRVGEQPMGITASAVGIWVANYGSDTVTEIDPRTNRVVATASTGGGPIGIAQQGGQLWVGDNADSAVTRRSSRFRDR